MATRFVMTARRKAALRKAQLASARKRRKGAKLEKYGKSYRKATNKQKINRNNRAYKRINRVRIAVGVGALAYPFARAAYDIRQVNANIAYNGQATYRGQRFSAQGGPRFLRVKPTARGARRRNRADFRAQYGSKALRDLKRNMKRQQRAQRRHVRNTVRNGRTTMMWGPRQQALPRGRR